MSDGFVRLNAVTKQFGGLAVVDHVRYPSLGAKSWHCSDRAVTELDVAVAAANAFLKAVAAEQAVRSAQANVERMETFSKAVRVLVENELRPGADASRTDAELAAARNSLIQTKQQAGLARVALAEAVGLTITFSPSDIFNLRARRRQEASNLIAEQARYDLAVQQLKAEEANARVLAESAREYTENAPRQLQAAQETELRVRRRFEAELATVTDVAESQRLLAQAEVESALARLSVWRARLAEARAKGDLKPFLDQFARHAITIP